MSEDYTQYYQDGDIEDAIRGKSDVSFGVPFYTPQPSEDAKKWRRNRVRILPPRIDHVDLQGQPSTRFYLWVATHFVEEARRYVLCPNRNFDQDSCPICREANNLSSQGFKDDAKKLWPNWKALVNVIELNPDGSLKVDEDDGKPEVKVWAISKTLAEELLDRIAEMPAKERNIAHPQSGRDVIVKRQGKNEYSKYQWADDFPEASPLPKVALAALANMHKLFEVYPRMTSDRITALLEAPASKPNADPFADDDDDEAIVGVVRELPLPVDDADDDEPAPPPKKSRGKSALKEVDPAVEEARRRLQAALEADDDDDTEDDDDE